MMSFDQILSDMILDYQKLSGVTPLKTSDIYIKLKTLASQIFSLHTKLDWVQKQVFPQTSTGKYLDYHAQTRGLTRKKSSPSTGILTFSITSPAKSDIQIPENTICFSPLNPNMKFVSLSPAIIKQGEEKVDVQAKSTINGFETNLKAGEITNMSNPPKFVENVINQANFEGGCDEETDSSLRKRIFNSFKNISNGSNAAYYHNIAMDYDGVASVNVIPRNRGRGTVDIVIATNKPIKNLIEKMQREIQEQKEINVDVSVLEAEQVKIDIDLHLEIEKSYKFSEVENEAKSIINQYIANIEVYQPLKLAALGAKIFNISGVKNYQFTNPNKDVFIKPNEIICLNKLNITQSS